MKKRRKHLYPGMKEAEQERTRSSKKNEPDEKPDFIGGCPNYEKFGDVPAEHVLVWLNID